MSQKFPEVQGGGSLIVAWQIRNKHVLVVGGGEVGFFLSKNDARYFLYKMNLPEIHQLTCEIRIQVASGRILHALNADANVTVVCPKSGLNEEVAYRVAQNQVSHIDRNFEPHDLDNADMVLCAIDDPEASTQVWKLCKKHRIPANIADVPPECDFYFGSMHRDGPLQIMVSTNGNGPKLANIVRQKIAQTLPQNTGAAIENVGLLRKKLREIAPDTQEGPKRMKW
jgi:precorrin-2 dehydrogenase/sirohydrochlorin ferrochelatase